MPLVLDDAPAAAGGGAGGGSEFDVAGASTLFWKPVPVVLRSPEREDVTEALTLRILSGSAKHNTSLRILRIHVYSEKDPFFLHSLEVSEEAFQALKNEQGILVDFGSFPDKVVSLLERCGGQRAQSGVRFQAVLTVRGNESTFRIVETNDFKQLPHITLAFHPGDDASVKEFLAFRLGEVKAGRESLAADLKSTQDAHASTLLQLADTESELVSLRERHARTLMQADADAKAARAAAAEAALEERSALLAAADARTAELERRLRGQLDEAGSRCAALDADVRRLRDAKYELDARVSELSHQLGSAQGSARALEAEVGRLRAAHAELSASAHEQLLALNDARAGRAADAERLSAAAALSEQQAGRVADLEGALRQLEERVKEQRAVAAAAEVRSAALQAEVVRGNGQIDSLSAELRAEKERSRRKAAIVARQEEELAAQSAALAEALRELSSLTSALEGARSDAERGDAERSELRAKLDESREQLASNEQMIRWLNQQVTEAQLGGAGAALSLSGSRYGGYRAFLTPGPSTRAVSSLPAPNTAGGAAVATPLAYARTPRALGSSLASAPQQWPGISAGMGAYGPRATSSADARSGEASAFQAFLPESSRQAVP